MPDMIQVAKKVQPPMGAKLLAPAEGWWPSATNWGPFGPPFGGRRVPIRYPQNFMKIGLDLAEIYRF